MRPFKDTAGRQWEVAINVATIRRVREFLKFDLLGVFDDGMKPLAELLADACRFVDVLFVLVKPQADAAKVSDESFGAAMGGDSLQAANEAFLEELADFFPSQRADTIRRLLAETKKVATILETRANKQLDALDADQIAAKLIGSFGVAPASSEFTPDHSP
jgi:hypothetical protein